jgi:hypothetical protein
MAACDACMPASKNKGSLALLFFQHQDIDLPHDSLLDLTADDFRSLVHGDIGYIKQNQSRHEASSFLLVPWDMSEYRFS